MNESAAERYGGRTDTKSEVSQSEYPAKGRSLKRGNHLLEWAREELNRRPHAYQALN